MELSKVEKVFFKASAVIVLLFAIPCAAVGGAVGLVFASVPFIIGGLLFLIRMAIQLYTEDAKDMADALFSMGVRYNMAEGNLITKDGLRMAASSKVVRYVRSLTEGK